MAVRIVYETHAKSTDNEAGFATGWLPGQLSESGRVGARELGQRRRDDGFDVVYFSDLERALDTVRIAFEGSDIPIRVDRRLRECNYGRFNGMPRGHFQGDKASHVDVPWPEGESYRDVVSRMRLLLADLLREWDNHRVLLVGHSANRWALEHLIDGRDLHELVVGDFDWQPGWEYTLENRTLTV
jgi:broad specificity phosphatase PhoE